MLFPTHIIISLPLILILDTSTALIIIGCTIPDIIDKQLPKLGLTENYHSIMHSGITVLLFSILSILYPPMIGLTIGLTTHIILDIIHVILNKRYNHMLFILWPVKFDPDPLNIPPSKFFRHYIGTISFYFEFIIWFICIYIAFMYQI